MQVCAALPAEALPPPLRALAPLSERSYRELKEASTSYRQRRAAFLGSGAFLDWVSAPSGGEEFTAAAESVPPGRSEAPT